MPDTIRSVDAFLNPSTGLFKDNTTRDIQEQDLRDFALSSYRPQAVPFCGYLTIDSTNRVNQPVALTPSSTDTTADTCTYSAGHHYVTGTMVTPGATAGGLTAGTTYYLNCPNNTTFSFHTTLADAVAGTSKVNLTASIGALSYYGMAGSTLYLHAVNGHFIGLYDGTSWKLHNMSASISLALSSLTSDKNYDVYLYDSSGTLTLELTVWTDDVTRATELAWHDGVLVKSGTATRRYVGTIRTTSATTTEDSVFKRFVANNYNQRFKAVIRSAGSSSHTWNSTERNYNGSATSTLIQFVLPGITSNFVYLAATGYAYQSVAGDQRIQAKGYHGTLSSGTVRITSTEHTAMASIGSASSAHTITALLPSGYYEAILKEVAYSGTISVDFGAARAVIFV